jgi:hypothetical protein
MSKKKYRKHLKEDNKGDYAVQDDKEKANGKGNYTTQDDENEEGEKELLINKSEDDKDYFVKEESVSTFKGSSYERFIESVKSMAQENRPKIVGENINTNIHPIATFKNHAIFADDTANLYRLHYESSKGDVTFLKSEKIENIKRYTKEQIEQSLDEELSSALIDVIANPNGQCENKLKETFNQSVGLKSKNNLNGFIRFKDIN